MKAPHKQESLQTQITKIIVGIDLGNHTTNIYFKDKFYTFRTELTINFHQQLISIGHKHENLQKILEDKKKNQQQGKFNNLNQNLLPIKDKKSIKSSTSSKRIIDFLDLLIKNFTQRKLKQQKRKEKLSSNSIFKHLPKQFSFYPYDFQEVQKIQDGVEIILQKNCSDLKEQLVTRSEEKKAPIKEQTQSQYGKENKNNTIRVDQCLSLFLKQILTQIITQNYPPKLKNQQKHTFNLQFVVSHYGYETNPYLVCLQNIAQSFTDKKLLDVSIINEASCTFIHSTLSLVITYYIQYFKQKLQKSIIIGSLDFGSRGCSFAIQKLYPKSQKVIETLQHFSIQFGSIDITRILMDFIIQDIKAHRGVNVRLTHDMIQNLYNLAEQTRKALNESQKVYIRVEGYPLTEPYVFYVKRETIDEKIKNKIFEIIDKILKVCERHVKKQRKLQKIILSGNSCLIPLFKTNFYKKIVQKYGCQIIDSGKDWISKGNLLYRASGIVVLQKSTDEIILKGDEDYSEVLVDKNSDFPVRLTKEMQFPRGELTYILKLIENESIIGSYLIKSQHLQWGEPMNFIVEKQQHKSLSVYSSKYLGKIQMRGGNLCKPIKINEKFQFSINQHNLN